MGVPVNDRVHLAPDDQAREIDPEAVELLNEVIDRTGAKIVVSSSWRCSFETLADLRGCLIRAGIRNCIISKTPYLNSERHKEVERWLSDMQHRVERYAVIDDSFGPIGALDESRCVWTRFDRGMTRESVEALVRILGEVR